MVQRKILAETSVTKKKKKALEMRLQEEQEEQNAWKEHRSRDSERACHFPEVSPVYLHHFHFRFFYLIDQRFI